MTLKKLLANLLLATVLPALGHAQTVDICGRTPQVRDAIMGDLGAEDCAAVDSAQMAELRLFIFSRNRLTALPAGVSEGLTNLNTLELTNNRLVGSSRNDPLFAMLPSEVDSESEWQTEEPDGLEPPATRLANTGANAASVSTEGVDGQGNTAGPVTLTLAAPAKRKTTLPPLPESALARLPGSQKHRIERNSFASKRLYNHPGDPIHSIDLNAKLT